MFRWTKTIWTAIGLGLVLVSAQVSYGGNWPIEPRDQTHPIGNSGAELHVGGSGFHQGIDIVEDFYWPENGAHWVVTKDQGSVLSGTFTECDTSCEITLQVPGKPVQIYKHLDSLSIQPAIIDSYNNLGHIESVLPAGTHVGKVVQWSRCPNHPNHDYYHHLHFETVDTAWLEPVLGLDPNTDTNGPFIEGVWFTKDDSVGSLTQLPQVGPFNIVQGKIDIIVKAFDRQFVTATQNHKTAVLKLQYTVTDSLSNVVKTGKAIDLSIIPNDDTYANVLYANDGTFQSSADYCTPAENYFYIVTNVDNTSSMPQTFTKNNSWDTTMHSNGTYQVEVTIKNDYNSVSRVEQVKIENPSTANIPPQPPEGLEVH